MPFVPRSQSLRPDGIGAHCRATLSKGLQMASTLGNRESWLADAMARYVAPHFAAQGYVMPETRVSCGFPLGTRKPNGAKAIGQCWSPGAAADNRAQIFISPTLDDGAAVLATLVHEAVHAVDRNQSGHGAAFRRIAESVGLAGKMTSTHAGEQLAARIREWIAALGEYPHAALVPSDRKKQSTRLLKCECAECGYTVRVTRKWIDAAGAPLCPNTEGDCYQRPMMVAA